MLVVRKGFVMSRSEKRQAKYNKKKEATQKAADKDKADKEALAEKMAQKGGAGKLTRAEIKLAKRTGEVEGQKKT